MLKRTGKPDGGARIGFGYDIHRLVEGRRLVLGGVRIPSATGLLGHSDADVLLHAICDALLGAAALGDIGHHFPDTDRRFRNISSLRLLRRVRTLLQENRFTVVNIDSTVVLEQPKIGKYIPRMRKCIRESLGIDPDRISIKATTNEELGALGAGKGCAAFAVASIIST